MRVTSSLRFATAAGVVIAASLALAIPAYAQMRWDKIIKGENRLKITCFADALSNYKFPSGDSEQVKTHGLVSESIRTTVITDGVEYRSSDFTSYGEGGTPTSRGHAEGEVKITVDGDQEMQVTHMVTESRSVDPQSLMSGEIKRSETNSEVHYRIDGNNKYVLGEVSNGKTLADRGAVETTTQLSPRTHQVKTVYKTPYIQEFDGAYGKWIEEVIKYELTCTYERMD